MDEVMMLCDAEPRKTLQVVIEKRTPAIMSYLSHGKWHAARIVPVNLGADRFYVEVAPRKRPCPINVQLNQPVGISLKHGYGKLVFETTVISLELTSEPQSGGRIVLAIPTQIKLVPRRSYFRVNVPESLKVNVIMWHRNHTDGIPKRNDNKGRPVFPPEHRLSPEHYWQGRLVDISAGGVQIAIDSADEPDFKKGQFVGLRFTPMPYETPLMFNAQIRTILPTVDDDVIYFGLQMVGLEASIEGRAILQRLCNIVERYYQMNQSSLKQLDLQTVRT
ncbi:MAG: flagellar brake protein [Planctomycetota bacterium]